MPESATGDITHEYMSRLAPLADISADWLYIIGRRGSHDLCQRGNYGVDGSYKSNTDYPHMFEYTQTHTGRSWVHRVQCASGEIRD